jgi:hypothetical protein
VHFALADRKGEALDDFFFADGDVEIFDFELGHVRKVDGRGSKWMKVSSL